MGRFLTTKNLSLGGEGEEVGEETCGDGGTGAKWGRRLTIGQGYGWWNERWTGVGYVFLDITSPTHRSPVLVFPIAISGSKAPLRPKSRRPENSYTIHDHLHSCFRIYLGRSYNHFKISEYGTVEIYLQPRAILHKPL
jgi:hypothetical protein